MIKPAEPTLVVAGNGMVGQRFLEELVTRGGHLRFRIIVLGEEPRPAYDRVHLSELFAGRSADDLRLAAADFHATNGIELKLGARVAAINREERQVTTTTGETIAYDHLVLATGSSPFVPPVSGAQGPGRFVYRTIEDLDAIRAYAQGHKVGVVIGGGLLGLECANALKHLGLETHVIEFAPQLMAVQVDATGGTILRRLVEGLGVRIRTSTSTTRIAGEQGVERLEFADKTTLDADLVVFSAGIRPRDELAKAAGLTLGERGGVAVDDACRTSDAAISAIGEVACHRGRIYGLVAPGYQMAAVCAAQLMGDSERTFTGADLSTKLKLMGVDVASFGDSHGRTPKSRSFAFSDEVAQVYKRIVISEDGKTLLGGILVGDAADYAGLHQIMLSGLALPEHPDALILPDRGGTAKAHGGPETWPDTAQVCTCNNVSKGTICKAIDGGVHDLPALKAYTKAGTGCGGCTTTVGALLKAGKAKLGLVVSDHICEHFPHSRQQLHHICRVEGIRSFQELLTRHGKGLGCEVCKPAVGSILASLWNEHILAAEHAGLQDTNDRYLANMQKDGTYSVVPRVPGGEITPDQLIVIGQVAKRYDLYAKITGGQRIDLLGARLEELPDIWKLLIDAGFESGHAYGKAFRTCKTCVGTTWCRYGQQDSVGLGIRIENRYKGLRSPHKLKMAVSGCTRECAEARGKDIGVIATERGYNLYVGGNGGMKPRHADLFATDLSDEQVLRYTDRILMFYIRTADRLQRTSVWLEGMEGGLDYLRKVVIDDSLGICAELDAAMQSVADTYQDEWRTAVEDPQIRKRFTHFINSEAGDDGLRSIRIRGQRVPALAEA